MEGGQPAARTPHPALKRNAVVAFFANFADTAAVVWDKDRLLLRRESQTGM